MNESYLVNATGMKYQKILLHNLSIQYTQPNNELFDFDQNALFFAEPGDIVVTRKKISGQYLEFLSHCGMNFEGVTFVSSQSDTPSGMKDVFFDESIIRQLRSAIDRKRNPVLDSFILTEYEAAWAKKLNIDFVGNSKDEAFGGKSAFRSLAKKHGFSLARGFEDQNNVLDGALKAAWLFSTGFPEVIIKYDEGSVSLDSRRFTRQEFLSKFSSFEYFLSDRFLHQVIPKYSRNFVVEGWYNDVLYSPSIQLFVSPSGIIEIVSMHVQLFYEDKMRYKGCLSSHFIEEKIREQLITEGAALAKIFSEKGYRGHFSFDAILLPNKKLLWEELNPRRTMTSYSFQLRKKIFGERADTICYSSKYIQNPHWKGKTIEDILNLLRPALFSNKGKSGIIPFNYGLLSSEGRVAFIAFSENEESVNRLLEYAENF